MKSETEKELTQFIDSIMNGIQIKLGTKEFPNSIFYYKYGKIYFWRSK